MPSPKPGVILGTRPGTRRLPGENRDYTVCDRCGRRIKSRKDRPNSSGLCASCKSVDPTFGTITY